MTNQSSDCHIQAQCELLHVNSLSFLGGRIRSHPKSCPLGFGEVTEFKIQEALMRKISTGSRTLDRDNCVATLGKDEYRATSNNKQSHLDIQFFARRGNVEELRIGIELKTPRDTLHMGQSEMDRAVGQCIRYMEEHPNLTTVFILICQVTSSETIKLDKWIEFSPLQLSVNANYVTLTERVTAAIRRFPNRVHDRCIASELTA